MKIPFVGSSPIRKNFLANLLGIGVQFFNQVVLVPFYLLFWGNDLYSDWLLISAFTAFFTISDIGLNNVIQNRFAVKLAEGNRKECNALLTDNFVLVTGIFLLLLSLSVGYLCLFDITDQLGIHQLSRTEASWVFVLLLSRVFIDMYRTIQNAIYRAIHLASRSIVFDQCTNLATALITLACVMAGARLSTLAIVILLPTMLMLVVKYVDVQKYYRYRFTFKDFDRQLLKELLVPAVSFMSFPMGNAIVLQGYTLVVNYCFGANAVVLYNTTRTLCNFAKTLLNTLQNSVWPEYSIAFGNQDFERMRYLHRRILKVTVGSAALICAGILLLGPWIYEVWTRDTVSFSYSLMAVYVSVLFVESLWSSSSVTLMATNNHIRLGALYLFATVVVLGMAAVVGISGGTLAMVAASLLLLHVVMCLYTLPAGFRLTRDSIL